MNNQSVLAAAPDHIADASKMVAPAGQGEPEGVRSLLVECERALCCPDPAQRQVTASKILRMLAASTAPAVQGEPVAYISHTSEGDILGWERRLDAPSHTTLYTAPQPAPDVTGLVEALEAALMVMTSKEVRLEKQADAITMARAALAAHRKQGGEV